MTKFRHWTGLPPARNLQQSIALAQLQILRNLERERTK